MISRIAQLVNRTFVLFLLFLSCAATSALGAEGGKLVGGLSPEDALRAGERLYRTGVLPSGKPVAAIIRGDKRITGGDLTPCANCHTRSGLGAVVEEMLVPPISGPKLYAPLKSQQNIPGPIEHRSMFENSRPAYTDKTLANALLKGVAPSGRSLSPFMPRYLMTANEVEVMVHYLKNLSTKLSPGVEEKEIRFAVVLSEKVSQKEKDALLQPLEAYFREEWNGRVVAMQAKRSTRWNGGDKPVGPLYRKVALDIWELKGGPEEWRSQLEAHYSGQPVFALLGGLVPGSWEPVHRFCEDNGIPCIFPLTELPVLSSTDWYTLYFSKGYYQEGAAVAKYLAKASSGAPAGTRVVQVFRENAEGRTLALGFADAWKKTEGSSVTQRIVAPTEKTDTAFWKRLAADHPGAVVLLWLGSADLAGSEALLEPGAKKTPSKLFLSATMLGRSWQSIPDRLRGITYITYPSRLPEDSLYSRATFSNWMRMKRLPVLDQEISSKVYLMTRLLSFTLVDMGTDYYRDFFLDLLDIGKDQTSASVVYPLLRFGPGQRYASVGCYVVTLTKGVNPRIVKQGEWVSF
ncbi:MAG: ABC transporter substrate-binding protein [Geobacteraceae bacterium]|jgi:hypothetical protein